MSDAKFTPGPWEAVENGGDYATDVFAGDLQVADCDWPQGEMEPTTREANARLVASAPDLLAACKAFLWRVREFRDDPRLLLNLFVEVEPLVERAVAKAEGGG